MQVHFLKMFRGLLSVLLFLCAGSKRCSTLTAAAASLSTLTPGSLPAAAHALPKATALLQLAARQDGLDASSFLDTARCFLGEVHRGVLSAVSTDALLQVAITPHWLPASYALAIGSLGESLTEMLYAVSRQADALVQQQLTSAPQLRLRVAVFATPPLSCYDCCSSACKERLLNCVKSSVLLHTS